MKEIKLYEEWQYTRNAFDSVLALLCELNDGNSRVLNQNGMENMLRAQAQVARFNSFMDLLDTLDVLEEEE